MEIKQQFQIDLASKSSLVLTRSVPGGVSLMNGFKRSKFPLGRSLDSRAWGSETDIRQSSLPPIQSSEKKNSNTCSNFKWIPNNSGKQLYPNRPPTPSPSRQQDSVFSFGKTSRISPSNSSQRLSLSLDLRPVVEGTDISTRRHSSGFADHSPELEWSPRLPRSLPPSPNMHRSHRFHHRVLRRLSNDSEPGDAKDDRILNWLRDVSEKTHVHAHSFEYDDEDNLFDCSLDKNDDSSFNSVTGLPVIQEGKKT